MAQVGKQLIVGKERVARPPPKVLDVPGKTSKGRSKSKIPKTVRYELENALVSLCDIWFDEIKPHLINNKIKLHVNEDDAGDKQPKRARHAQECSHHDPGDSDRRQRQNASSAVCWPTQQTASTARYRRPLQQPFRPPCHRLSASPVKQQQNHSIEYTKRRTRRRRKVRKHTQSETRLRIPRLCNNLDSEYKSNQPKPSRSQKYPINVKNNKSKALKDKYTQTEYSWLSRRDAASTARAPKRPQRPRAPRKQHTAARLNVGSLLFNADLVDRICSNYNASLEVLYRSPSRSECSSVTNLVSVSNKKPAKKKKVKPWR